MKEVRANQKQKRDESANYREVLVGEFESRVKRNPSYSLRAFARDLGVAPSGLSRVLRNEQGLSLAAAIQISKKLELERSEEEVFCALVLAEHARSFVEKKKAIYKLKEISSNQAKELDLEYFKTISNWYNFALLALTEVSDFESTSTFVAKRLGITPDEAQNAIQALEKLNLLKRDEKGNLKKVEALISTPGNIPSRAIKNHHVQIMKKAEAALFDQENSKREFASISFAMNEADMVWAKEEMQKFRRDLAARLAKRKSKERLYHLSMQLFAIDTIREKNKE